MIVAMISCLRFLSVAERKIILNHVSSKNSPVRSLQPLLALGHPLVVGTMHQRTGLAVGCKCTPCSSRGIDILEARLDCLEGFLPPEKFSLPVIATARHPAEGGTGNLPVSCRSQLLREALTWASAIDVELRSASALAPVVAEAHQHGRTVILSHHDFAATPTVSALQKLSRRAADAGADLFKVATMLRDQHDLQRLIQFQVSSAKIPVVAMGMGTAGRFSRLVLCGFGAPLCYGWLGKPQVPGQWPALKLRGMLDEVLPA